MKKFLCHLVLLATGTALFAQSPIQLSGKVGKYSIEVELNPTHQHESNVKGRYRYAGKTTYLDLTGDYYDDGVIYLQESYEGKETGQFFLEMAENGHLTGTWIGTKAVLEVDLAIEAGELSSLLHYRMDDYQLACSDAISGTYYSGTHWINDMWFTEEEPNLEIGFNGGVVTVEERGQDSIFVFFDLICGPTYHMAYFSGTAARVSAGKYVYRKAGEYGDEEDPCHLIFEFKNKTLDISQESSSMACGFGARAYAEGTFPKVLDKVVKGEGLSLRDIVGE